MIGVLAVAAACCGRASAQPVPEDGIPGNVLAIGETAAEALAAVNDEVAEAMQRLYDVRNSAASLKTAELNRSRRQINAATNYAAGAFLDELNGRVYWLLMNGVDDVPVSDFAMLSEPVLGDILAAGAKGRSQLSEYARVTKSSAGLVRAARGTYQVRVEPGTGSKATPIAEIRLNEDFTVTGDINYARIGLLLGGSKKQALVRTFGTLGEGDVEGVRWYIAGGKIHLVGSDFDATAAVKVSNISQFRLQGVDLIPEAAKLIGENVIDDEDLESVKPGLVSARTIIKGWQLRFTRTGP